MTSAPRKQKQPALRKVSEQMRAWSAGLQAEVQSWPNVSTRKMFGMVSLYRAKRIFAALPYTRMIGSEDGFIFKVLVDTSSSLRSRLRRDARIVAEGIGSQWIRFRFAAKDDLQGALAWLSLAYESAGKRAAKRKRTTR